jgi:hypothetical protein
VVIALLGKIKSEHHNIACLIPCVPVTSYSGIKVKDIIKRLIKLKESQGHVDGPTISGVKNGRFLSM